jgi:hemerythrin
MDKSYTWDPTYSVGNDVLDDQHKIIFDICDRLHQLVSNESALSKEQYLEFIDEAIRFARTHFHTEEHYLRKNRFPHLEAHIEEHRQFMERLSDLQAKVQDEKILADHFGTILRTWLRDHILHSDFEYKSLFF